MAIKDEVSEALRAAQRPLGAYDVIRKLEPTRGKLAPTTVYRALNALVSEGCVHRIESLNAYVACPSTGCGERHGAMTAFAICDDCGSVAEHHDAAVAQSLGALAEQSRFRAVRHVVEIHGRCGACDQDAGE